MQGGLSHINVIHQGSRSPLAQQEQLLSGYVLPLPGFRLGADLDLQPVEAQHLTGVFCPLASPHMLQDFLPPTRLRSLICFPRWRRRRSPPFDWHRG